MTHSRPGILDHAATLSEPTRCRILQLVDRHELTVSELCAVLRLPQSTTSRHLKLLADAGWVRSRRDGTSHLYRRVDGDADTAPARLWSLIREQLADTPASRDDRRRLAAVLAERRARSQEFFSTTAAGWDRLRDELFGARFDLQAFLGLLDPGATVGDLGCGTGRLSEALAPFVGRLIAVDGSPPMLEAARARLVEHDHVELRQGELEALPIDDRRLDLATLMLALHHVPEPAEVLAEAGRVLKPGGRLLIVDMQPHERESYRSEMGHVWLGFTGDQLAPWLSAAGLTELRYRPLPADAEADGPPLFAATVLRSAEPSTDPTLERPQTP